MRLYTSDEPLDVHTITLFKLWFNFHRSHKVLWLSTLDLYTLSSLCIYIPLLSLALNVPIIHCPIQLSLWLQPLPGSRRCCCRNPDHAMPALPPAAWTSDQDTFLAGPFINSHTQAHDAPWCITWPHGASQDPMVDGSFLVSDDFWYLFTSHQHIQDI